MKKRKKRKQTPNQIEYSKQIKRIKQAIRRLEKRGYVFETNIVSQKPKRITEKAIKRLQEITTNVLYEKAVYVNQDTGEIISGEEGKQLELKERAKKAQQTRKKNTKRGYKNRVGNEQNYFPDGGEIIYSNIVENFISRLAEPTSEYATTRRGRTSKRLEKAYQETIRAKNTLLSITYSVIEEIGKSELGWRLQEKADDVNVLTNYVLYGSDASRIASACSELATIINGGALSMQQLMDIAEQEEENEDWEEPV